MNFFLLLFGLGFILIDFSVEARDILPDLIGYILLVIGLMPLTSANHHFTRARNVSILMIIIGVMSFIAPVRSVVTEMTGSTVLSLLISIGLYVIELIFVYSFFMGIADLARSRQQDSIYVRAVQLWKYYWVLIVVSFFGTIMAVLLGVIGLLIIIGFGIATLILTYKMLKLVYDSKSILTVK